MICDKCKRKMNSVYIVSEDMMCIPCMPNVRPDSFKPHGILIINASEELFNFKDEYINIKDTIFILEETSG